MAKKASGKTYTSKGLHSNVSRKTLNALRSDDSDRRRVENVQDAYLKGKNPWITIDNPNKNETNKRFIRVRANDVMKHPKERAKSAFIMV